MKKILGILAVVCSLALGVAQPVMAAPNVDPICSELDPTKEEDKYVYEMMGCNDDNPTLAADFANNIIKVVLGLMGLVAIGVMIFGGIMYATSTGDAAKVQRAKHVIMYGLIGFGVTLLAYAIVAFIMQVVSTSA